MNNSVLKLVPYNKNTEKQEVRQYGEYKGQPIELNIRCNFRLHEFNAVYNNKCHRRDWLDIDISYYEENFDSLTKNERSYARILATFRRINLDYFNELSTSINLNFYEYIDSIENFQIFNNYFEKYHDIFDPQHAKNNKVKNMFKRQSKLHILRLWMAGYGLLPNLTDNYITDELLEDIFKYAKKHNTRNIMKFLRFISFVLSQEDSPVSKEIVLVEGSSDIFERELKKWHKLENENNSNLLKLFKNFSINHYYKRTKSNWLHEYKDDNNNLVRETYQAISLNSFRNYSIGLRNMIKELYEIDIYTFDDALNYGILDVLCSIKDKYQSTKYSTMKIVTKALVEIYIKDNNLNLNIDKIIPPSIGRRDITFGEVLNVSDVSKFIEALLNNDLSFYKDISISDYRCRYMCLIMLSTGQRLSETICLAFDCIKPNKKGDFFINFHKNKTGDGNTVPATLDVLNYVDKLRAVAPIKELHFSKAQYPYFDDLKIRRLVANRFNSGPINPVTVRDFLERLQKYLWGEDFSKKDKIFKPHDLRRMKATYMSWNGSSEAQISKQLGQYNINSQLPYLQTKPVEHQEIFANMYQDGMYSELYKEDSDGKILINKDIIESKTDNIKSISSYEILIDSILSSINNADDINIQKVDSSILEPTGFPVSIYACSASSSIHCMKSRINCFGCDYYKPDDDSLESHKTELFRYILLHKQQLKSLKSTKDLMLKTLLGEKVKYLQNSINEAFDKLFKKFSLNTIKISEVKEELEKKSKSYIRVYGKEKLMPNFKEALKYIQEGKI